MNKLLLWVLFVLSHNAFSQLPYGFHPSSKGWISNGTYETEIRSKENHICFETDILIIRDSHGVFKNLTTLPERISPHPFIPNLYLLRSMAKNLPQLLIEKQSILNQWNVEVFFNQVFTLTSTTNDPNYNRQWSIENVGGSMQYNGTPGADMEVTPAWTYTKGAGVKVAVLDCGVDTLHPDLLGNLLPGFDGYADSITNTHGYPTPNFSSDGHGTACAGIVAALQDNNIGTTGIAPEAKVIPVRIFYYMQYAGNIGIQPFTSTLGLLNGAAYAWRIADCDIMSTSAGLSPLFIQALQINTQLVNDEIDSAFNQGRNGLGVSMFFSAGNDDINDVLWPANLETTMAVGASDMCDQRKSPSDCSGENWGSTFGYGLDFVAPGVKIATADMIGSEGFSGNAVTLTFNGTSAACPNAAGVAALMLGVNPLLTNEQIHEIMSWTAEKVSYTYDSLAPFGTWDLQTGYGRLNAHEAVLTALNTNETSSLETKPMLMFSENPSREIWIKNISSEIQKVRIMDALGKSYEVEIYPNEIFSNSVSSGLYWIITHFDVRKQVVF